MTFAWLGALNAFIAVAAGAFGAHGLKPRVSPEALATFETGARYHMYHSLALFAVAWLVSRTGAAGAPVAGARLAGAGGWAFVVGIVLFSGSLYGYALSGVRALAIVTPLGGLAFLVGWLLVAIAATR
jgi:uncharacterized membrane protein YgdD (TMEM256/DUF423 family)